MKNLTKIFMAVVALFAVACTTDMTGDLAPELGLGEGQTTLTLSLEESRTQLGEKVGELYPLYWSEGDAVAVNGAGYPVTISSENEAVAAIPGVPEASEYCIAYPVAPAGQVLFAEKQNHVVEGDTFEDGVSTMYAYSTSGMDVQLKHLTGILKFGITGSAKLSKLQVSTVNAPIAGPFNIDFKTGEVTPSAEAVNVIEYSFGESGLQLSETAQYVHIAVPAGEYNYLHVTLYDTENGVMTAAIQADKTTEKDKTLKVGKVREFNTPLNYTPNSTDFIIADYEDLVEFASIAATTEKNALVVENITVPADATWTSIEGYAKTFNGNGYTISGLKAPLFGTTSATIKSVKLTDVNIAVDDTLFSGAIAVTLESTETATAQLLNCEASGTITLNNNNVTLTSNFDATLTNIGGLVGRAYGATISKCVNRVNLVGATVSPADIGTQKKYYTPAFGGIVGFTNVAKSGSATTSISNCENYGSITDNDSKYNETYSSPAMGGIAGVINDKTAIVEYCDNHGPIAQNKNSRETDAGGIVGRTYASRIESCTNHEGGTITFVRIGRYSFFGGIAGNSYTANYINCTNKADITYQPSAKTNTGYQYIGGIVGHLRTTAHTITGCVNEGNILHTGNVYGGTSNSYAYIGGIAGFFDIGGTVTNCENKGEISVTGIKGNAAIRDKLTDPENPTTSGTETHFATGGVFGYISEDTVVVSDCTNSGTINYDVTIYGKGNLCDQYVGGIAGWAKTPISSSTNTGSVNINTQVEAVEGVTPAITLCVGGCVGCASKQINGCTNKGTVTFAEGAKAYGYSFGGLVGHTTATVVDSHNEGAVNIYGDATETDASYSSNKIGGLAGYAGNTMTNSTNKATGVVTVTGKMFPSGYWPDADAGVAIGGLVAHKNGSTSGCHNYAPLNVTLNLEQGSFDMIGGFYIAGLLGYTGATATNCSNEGKITVGGTYNLVTTANRYGHLDIAGCIGRIAKAAYSNVDNKGAIEVNVNYTPAANGHSTDLNNLLVGGVFSGFGGDEGVTGCDNSGNITIGEGTIVEQADVFLCVGGVSATSATGVDYVECTNTGNITMNGTAKHGAIIGGVLARYVSVAEVKDCSNSGSILVTTGKEGISYVKSLYVGGLAGSQSSKAVTITNFTNNGSITFRGKTTDICRLGGVIGSLTQATTAWSGLKNYGSLSAQGTCVDSKTFIGGIIGNSGKVIDGAMSYCSITAEGLTNVGWIMGTPRSSTVYSTNCAIGGYTLEYDTETEESKTVPAFTLKNYFDYIYGGDTDWTGITNYDGCGYLESKTAEPSYPAAE